MYWTPFQLLCLHFEFWKYHQGCKGKYGPKGKFIPFNRIYVGD
jgi:hypothetical protein